jgi:hypothetical protein
LICLHAPFRDPSSGSANCNGGWTGSGSSLPGTAPRDRWSIPCSIAAIWLEGVLGLSERIRGSFSAGEGWAVAASVEEA